ncbi:MAG: MFS transporter [Rubritepida sp.]|nr:MFS transporter [Rubritepida sp.]
MSSPGPDGAATSGAGARAAFLRAFPAIATAIFIAAIDTTITATALPAIAAAFGVVDRISWVVVAYLVAATIAAPLFGRLGDAHGRRAMLLLGFTLQALGMLGAGLAPSFEALLAARLVQGVGGGALLTLAMAVVGETLPARERGRYQGYLVACFMSASAAGPLAGGWLTEALGWRAVFLAGLPLVALGAAMAWRLPRRAGAGAFRFDAPGTALFTVFVLALVAMLDRIQALRWEAALWAVGFALVAALAAWALLRVERRVPDPLLPIPLLAHPAIWRLSVVSACVQGVLVALISFLPLYLYAVRGVPLATVGAMLLPMSLGGGLGALLSGLFMARTGRNMLLASLGLSIAVLFLCGFSLLPGAVPLAWLPWLLMLMSFAFGTSFPVAQTTVQVAAGPLQLGVATASVQFMRNLGSAAGTALLGTLLFAGFTLADPVMAERFGAVLRGGREAMAALPEAERAAMAAGLADGYRALFAGAAVIMGVAAVMAWRVPLRRL